MKLWHPFPIELLTASRWANMGVYKCFWQDLIARKLGSASCGVHTNKTNGTINPLNKSILTCYGLNSVGELHTKIHWHIGLVVVPSILNFCIP